MKKIYLKGACWTRGKETFACSSQGFRRESTNMSVNKNCKKGGMTLWRS